ncbi:MAG: serine/threonine protein kinase [Cyanobacteria bacterium SZAS LIN-5]|nr:serine/threonine protein kinase [Cyanobacteria bacterium SZAS LIN-5]
MNHDRNKQPPKSDGNTVDIKLSPGTIIATNYKVLACIGSGGMSDVYQVEQIFLGKEFALKLLAKQHHTDSAVRRFQQEARTTAQLKHPSLIEVHDFGIHGDDQPFLVMDLVEGYTLAQLLKKSGSLSLNYVIPLALQLCEGLHYAHLQGVVHRDIKPSNIMILNPNQLPGKGTVKILDFGIAKLSQSDQGEIQELTKTGEIFGSPIYMSPEQCQGTPVDLRTDIYSLGCVLFECLTGTPPFIGENAMTTMLMRITDKPPTLKEASLGSEFPSALEAVIVKMLEVNVQDRYQGLDRLITDLKMIKEDLSVKNETAVARSPAREPGKNRRELVMDLSIVVITAVLSCLAMSFIDRKVIFAAEFSADQAFRDERKRESELADKKSAQKVFVDYKAVLHYPTREFVGNGAHKREVLHFPSKCGRISLGSTTQKPEIALGDFYPDGKLVNLYLDEEDSADPNILKNLVDVNFGLLVYAGVYRVSDDTLKMLSNVKHVKKLDIAGSDITTLEPIVNLPLEALDIDETRLPAAEILKYNHLQSLNELSFGPVDDPTSVLKMLGRDSLAFLSYMGGMQTENESKVWRELSINDVKQIASMPNIRTLCFHNCKEFTDNYLTELLAMKNLHGLIIKDCSITAKSLPALRRMHLQFLRITARGWSEAELSELKKIPIKQIDVDESNEAKVTVSRTRNADLLKGFNFNDPALNKE